MKTARPAPPWLSVVIPVQDPAEDIAGCLYSLAACREPGLEAILVGQERSGASLANAQALAREMLLPLKTISQPEASPGAMRNLGAAQARGEILFFTLPACCIPPGLPERLKLLFVDPSLSAVGGGVRALEPASPLARLTALEMSFNHGRPERQNRSERQNRPERESEPCPFMACAALRASAFRAAGMCNESLVQAESSDLALCQGLLAQGGAVKQDPELWVSLDLPGAWGQVWRRQIRRGENRFHELRSGLRLPGEAYLQPMLLLLALGLLLVLGPQDLNRAATLALICVLLLYPANRAFLKYVGHQEPDLLKKAFFLCLWRPLAWLSGMLKAALGRLGLSTK